MIRAITVMIGQTLLVRRNSLIAWSLSLSALVVMYTAMFPSIEKIDIEALLEQYPKELLRAFGFEESTVQLDTAIGFLNTELFGFMLPLAIVFLPVGVIVHMTSKAEERGYLDALLAAPIARWQLIVAASIAATISLAVPVVAMIVVSLITGADRGCFPVAERDRRIGAEPAADGRARPARSRPWWSAPRDATGSPRPSRPARSS